MKKASFCTIGRLTTGGGGITGTNGTGDSSWLFLLDIVERIWSRHMLESV